MAGERVSEQGSESEWLGAASGQVAVELIVLLSHSVSPRHSARRPTNADTLFPYTLSTILYKTDVSPTLSLTLLQILIHRRKIFSRKVWVPLHTLHVDPFRRFRQRHW